MCFLTVNQGDKSDVPDVKDKNKSNVRDDLENVLNSSERSSLNLYLRCPGFLALRFGDSQRFGDSLLFGDSLRFGDTLRIVRIRIVLIVREHTFESLGSNRLEGREEKWVSFDKICLILNPN